MPFETKYLFTASMDVDADREDLFNEVYDKEHVPLLEQVPGVIAVARFKKQELSMMIGGERRTIVIELPDSCRRNSRVGLVGGRRSGFEDGA